MENFVMMGHTFFCYISQMKMILMGCTYCNTVYVILFCYINLFSTDYDMKSPSAVDYSDINELADDASEVKDTLHSDIVLKAEDGTDYDADDEDTGVKSDTQLMPPPPLPYAEKDGNTCEHEAGSGEGRRKKLDTPLAAMLPSKYQDVDVTEIFPDFRVDKVWSNDSLYIFIFYRLVLIACFN
jgi:hypothetical protein